jgi:ABC-type lipoprotein export system ATPase subunit
MSLDHVMDMINQEPLTAILERYPVSRDFFINLRLHELDWNEPLEYALNKAGEDVIEELELDRAQLLADFYEFICTFVKIPAHLPVVHSVTVLGGYDKSGCSEIPEWTIHVGETLSIVGPTGSGKSRLLGDIECLADRDTPTGRRILVDGEPLSEERRFNMEGKLVAQLSQNMNFIIDLTVREFLEMHAKCRMIGDSDEIVLRCFACANDLAGEKFGLDTKVTQLSGGQSRALMIADTAYISASPIVLLDEIENAGIDRRQAIGILSRKEKIVLISTHDPLLALGTDKRIVIRNGGVIKMIETSSTEKGCLEKIERMDGILQRVRHRIRGGEEISAELLKEQEV